MWSLAILLASCHFILSKWFQWVLWDLKSLNFTGNPQVGSLWHSKTSKSRAKAGRHCQPSTVDAAPLLRALVEKKPNCTLIQIGACDGDFGSSNDPVQEFLMDEPGVTALLVEASPKTYATLSCKVRKLGQEHRIRTLNVAVAPETGGTAPFYVVSEQFQQDYPRKAFHWTMCQLNSMDRQHVLKHHVHLGLTSEVGKQVIVWFSETTEPFDHLYTAC